MAKLLFDTYGKANVRLTYICRDAPRHEVRELSIKVLFEGDLARSYTEGDNSSVLPTDTIKNTIYVIARSATWSSIEELARELAAHFLRLKHLSQVSVEISQVPWSHIDNQPAAFVQLGGERRTLQLKATRTGNVFHAGLKNLQILKTANSAFAGFLKDAYTTLSETRDRLLGTVLDSEWIYAEQDLDFNSCHTAVRQTLLSTFATHDSLSVQQTLFAMGKSVLDAHTFVQEVHLTMPNKHCLLVDLTRFGLDNPNQVFVPTDEPSGYIEARFTRE